MTPLAIKRLFSAVLRAERPDRRLEFKLRALATGRELVKVDGAGGWFRIPGSPTRFLEVLPPRLMSSIDAARELVPPDLYLRLTINQHGDKALCVIDTGSIANGVVYGPRFCAAARLPAAAVTVAAIKAAQHMARIIGGPAKTGAPR